MKILSIDTSSDVCGVSILEDNNLICKLDTVTGRTHSENLMPMIDQALKQSNLELKNFDLIVCDKGPGSFTGIRIGIATAKSFHDSLEIPCIGINSLEALAYNVNDSKYICSILDCKNDNCYFALFEKTENLLENLIEPQADDISSALSILKSYCEDTIDNSKITFVGDGISVFKNQIKSYFENAEFVSKNLCILDSYNLGLCGYYKYKNGLLNEEELLPLYLKKPQAQRQLEEKLKSNSES